MSRSCSQPGHCCNGAACRMSFARGDGPSLPCAASSRAAAHPRPAPLPHCAQSPVTHVEPATWPSRTLLHSVPFSADLTATLQLQHPSSIRAKSRTRLPSEGVLCVVSQSLRGKVSNLIHSCFSFIPILKIEVRKGGHRWTLLTSICNI